jgi:hypothetical protein
LSASCSALGTPRDVGKARCYISAHRPPTVGDRKNGEKNMRNVVGMLRKTLGNVAAITAITTSVATVVTAAVVVSGLIGRVEKLESDLKLLRSDLEHPQVRPLASILDAGPRLRQ